MAWLLGNVTAVVDEETANPVTLIDLWNSLMVMEIHSHHKCTYATPCIANSGHQVPSGHSSGKFWEIHLKGVALVTTTSMTEIQCVYLWFSISVELWYHFDNLFSEYIILDIHCIPRQDSFILWPEMSMIIRNDVWKKVTSAITHIKYNAIN